jgi:hypothetical protein
MRPDQIPEIERVGRVVPRGGLNPLGSDTASVAATAPAQGVELEEFEANPKLMRFRAKRTDDVEFIVDVEFLVHVIKVLVAKHSITITPDDIEEMLSYFGEVVVKTTQQTYMVRDAEEPGCCGMSKAQQERVMTVIKSAALNGLNLARNVPDMLGFLTRIGVSIL